MLNKSFVDNLLIKVILLVFHSCVITFKILGFEKRQCSITFSKTQNCIFQFVQVIEYPKYTPSYLVFVYDVKHHWIAWHGQNKNKRHVNGYIHVVHSVDDNHILWNPSIFPIQLIWVKILALRYWRIIVSEWCHCVSEGRCCFFTSCI